DVQIDQKGLITLFDHVLPKKTKRAPCVGARRGEMEQSRLAPATATTATTKAAGMATAKSTCMACITTACSAESTGRANSAGITTHAADVSASGVSASDVPISATCIAAIAVAAISVVAVAIRIIASKSITVAAPVSTPVTDIWVNVGIAVSVTITVRIPIRIAGVAGGVWRVISIPWSDSYSESDLRFSRRGCHEKQDSGKSDCKQPKFSEHLSSPS